MLIFLLSAAPYVIAVTALLMIAARLREIRDLLKDRVPRDA